MERDEWLRAAWRVMVAKKVDPERLVFVDARWERTLPFLSCVLGHVRESGCTALCPATVGRTRPFASMGARGMGARGAGPTLAVEGATDREVFEAYVEEVLTQSLRSGQIVVMDNLTTHKGERVRELIEERGCELLYLPPYSPDLNPIEEAFSKIKGILRKAEGRSREALIEAMGRALDAITPQDAQSFFRHCGYLSLTAACNDVDPCDLALRPAA